MRDCCSSRESYAYVTVIVPYKGHVCPTFQVQQVLARYVRAADARDGRAMAKLFTPDARVEISYSNGGSVQPLGELSGRTRSRMPPPT